MKLLVSLTKVSCWALLAFLCAPPELQAQQVPAADGDAFAREQQKRSQSVMDAVLPRLIAALPEAEPGELRKLVVEVVLSRDPTKIQLDRGLPDADRLVISAGFLALQDVLTEASVMAVVANQDAALVDYSVAMTKYALQANYPASYRNPSFKKPEPFWKAIGWTQERHASFREDPRSKELVSRAAVQSHAWLVAYAISERLSETENDRAKLLERAGDLLIKAHLSPVPALGPSVLFFGTKNPDERQSNAWICASRSALSAAISLGERDRKNANAVRASNIDKSVREWDRVAKILDQKGHCSP